MNLSFETILQYYNMNYNYDNDFSKEKNGCYNLEEKQIELDEVLKLLKEKQYLEQILFELKTIKKKELYRSFNHGYHHNERVLIIGFLIAKLRNINDSNLKILMDACKYHDIGRVNDSRDDTHGLVSANKISKVIGDDPFYKEGERLNILKCAIDFHSTNDYLMDNMLETYEIKNKASAIEIMNILKDSDGLDRVRLSMGSNLSDLDSNYLRTNEAKSLVKFSHQLNEFYLYSLRKSANQDNLDTLKNEHGGNICLHGIGYDFFKLESILKEGILSKNELQRRNILSSRNFDGHNYGDYISVVCYGPEYYSTTCAYNNHVKDKIAFCIVDLDLIEGDRIGDLNYLDYIRRTTFPVCVEAFSDEKFVKDEIPKEKIMNLLIPSKILKLKLTDISYMSLSYAISPIEEKINYYISIIECKANQIVDRKLFENSLEKLKELDIRLKNSTIKLEDYKNIIKQELLLIDNNIGLLINTMYQILLEKEDVRVVDVINDILIRNDLSVSKSDENYLYINLGDTKKLI